MVECLTQDRGIAGSSLTRLEPDQRHCVVLLSKTLYPLLNTSSTKKDCPDITEKLLTDVKNQNKQIN